MVDREEVQKLAGELGLELETGDPRDARFRPVINHTQHHVWLRSIDQLPIGEEKLAELQKVFSENFEWIGPVYRESFAPALHPYFGVFPSVVLLTKKQSGEKRVQEVIESAYLMQHELKSRYLENYNYYEIENPAKLNAFGVQAEIGNIEEMACEWIPMYSPLTIIPNDPLWTDQWNLRLINAPEGWEITTGSADVVIAVLDTGCDLAHPDLLFSDEGVNLVTMMGPGSDWYGHGTLSAGIAAARSGNNEGVAGLAGNCRILPLAFSNFSNVEMAAGINYARMTGAVVINMSFTMSNGGGDFDQAIRNAAQEGIVLCGATGNFGLASIGFPAVHPDVIACGAVSTDDNRKTRNSPDGVNWASDYGDSLYGQVTPVGVSVVAPGVHCPSTDRLGEVGFTEGDYYLAYDGTSAATPHVAGLAALLKSQYPQLHGQEIRTIIERTAVKAGRLAYADKPGFPNGTRNEEMGYGRIDVFRALDFADVFIRDWPNDDGAEPSTSPGGNYWEFSDIRIGITDDDETFDRPDASQVIEGKTNYILVRVANRGPREARNVKVDIRIVPYAGQFSYPRDWTLEDSMHIRPEAITGTLPVIPAGASMIARFSLSPSQTDALLAKLEQLNTPGRFREPSWLVQKRKYEPTVIASVIAENDYAFLSANLSPAELIVRRNNLAQKNFTIQKVKFIDRSTPEFPLNDLERIERGLLQYVPFVTESVTGDAITLRIDAAGLPEKTEVLLSLDGGDPLEKRTTISEKQRTVEEPKEEYAYMEIEVKNILGGELIREDDEPFVRLTTGKAAVTFAGCSPVQHALYLLLKFPDTAEPGEYKVVVSQLDRWGNATGGTTMRFVAEVEEKVAKM